MVLPRWGFGSARAFGRFYVIGGYTDLNGSEVTGKIESFSSKTSVVQEAVSARSLVLRASRFLTVTCLQYTLIQPRAFPLVLSSANRIIVAGGVSKTVQFGHIDMCGHRAARAST